MVSNKAKKNQTNKTQHMTIFHLVITTGFKASHAYHGSRAGSHTQTGGGGSTLKRAAGGTPTPSASRGCCQIQHPCPGIWCPELSHANQARERQQDPQAQNAQQTTGRELLDEWLFYRSTESYNQKHVHLKR